MNRRKTKPRQSVSFDAKIPSKLICVEDRNAFSEQERGAIWYNADEIMSLQKQVKKLILNKEQLDDRDTDRGLEYHVAQHRREVAEKEGRPEAFSIHKKQILQAAQANCKQKGSSRKLQFTDIEELSHKLNFEALLQSDMLAAQDTAEAYSIYLEDMDPDIVNKCFRH